MKANLEAKKIEQLEKLKDMYFMRMTMAEVVAFEHKDYHFGHPAQQLEFQQLLQIEENLRHEIASIDQALIKPALRQPKLALPRVFKKPLAWVSESKPNELPYVATLGFWRLLHAKTKNIWARFFKKP